MEERRNHGIIPITLLAVILSLCLTETAALCPGSLSSDGICIFAPQPQTVASWDVAYGACAAENGHLAVVTSQERDRLVLDVMERSQIRKAWIGLREEDTPWYWVKEGRLIQNQGCYKHDADSPYFTQQVNIVALTQEKCLTECVARNYIYAGLKAGRTCHCGNSYEQGGATTGCNLPCSGNADQKCGAENAILVFYIEGAGGRWGYDQPNNLRGNQRCAAADIFFGGKLNDVICGSAFTYICELDPRRTTCSGTGYQMNEGRCYFISEAMLNWFEARDDCRKRGGDLADLDEATSDLVESILDSRVNLNMMWVGLRKGGMEWVNGETLAYTHWAPKSPNSTGPGCATYVTDNVNAWVDELCDKPLPFLCQIDHPILTTTTLPTTTKATTTKATTTKATTIKATMKPSTTTATTKQTQKISTTRTTSGNIKTTPQIISSSSSAGTTSYRTSPTPPTVTSASSQREPISSPVTSVTGSSTGNEEPDVGASSSGGLMSNGQIVIVVLAALLILILVSIGVIVVLMVKERKVNSKVACFSPRSQSVPSMDTTSNFNAHYDTIDKDTGRIIIP